MRIVLYAHSGLRYLVLLAALVLAVASLTGILTHKPAGKLSRILGASFVGLLDLQILLGLTLLLLGLYTPRVIGHLVLMLTAAAVAHTGHVMARRRPEQAHRWRLGGVLVASLLIALAIAAIGRTVFQSTAF
jgi:hypothetical protein